MNRATLENLSVISYIKEKVLLKDFLERRVGDSLEQLSTSEYKIIVPEGFSPNPFQRGRGIVYYDEMTIDDVGPFPVTTQEQQNRVVVKDAGNFVISNNNYTVDYTSGRILNPIGATPAKVDYYYNYVSVLDSDLDVPEAEKIVDVPFIVVSSEGQSVRKPLQLGGGKITPRKFSIYIYASSKTERDDLVQVLMDGFEDRTIPIVDYNQTNGLQLNYDGTFNSNFSVELLDSVSGCSEFNNVFYRHIKGTRDFTYSERYRSIISMELVSYLD